MDFTFLKATGEVAFFRSDAEQADWTQEEFGLHCTFPYTADKVIERGMVILFSDPATGDWQAYEVRQCTLMPGDGYQQFEAEDIAISELTDCHIQNQIQFDNTTAQAALSQILSGTGWSIGNDLSGSGTSSGDVNRGGVWTAVTLIAQNWNVHILPRVTVDSTGITGRYLDILPSSGFDRGLRLAVNKNVTDPCVVYDDTELYTALYGYGGTYTEGSGDSRVTLEYNFSAVNWAKTADHPAKPSGQRYIEWPEKTALYGRNGRPRFGYYQNTNIKDPNILLQKTWESLKACCDPKISITGTVADLKRLGYADQPLRLYDLAIVELEPVGLLFYKQIVKLTVDLLDATKNLPTIGDYVPNIIYINRETEKSATGGSKGRGGGGGGNSKVDLEMSKYQTDIYDTLREVGMYARELNEQGEIIRQAGMHIDPETGVLVYATDADYNLGSMFKVAYDGISAEVRARQDQDTLLSSRITQTANAISLEVSERKGDVNSLSGRINVEANRITAEVTRATTAEGTLSGRIQVNSDKVSVVVEEKDGQNVVKAASIVAGINDQEGSYVKIQAAKINLSGYVTVSQLEVTDAKISNLTSGATTASSLKTNLLSASTGFTYQGHSCSFKTVTVGTTTYHLVGY